MAITLGGINLPDMIMDPDPDLVENVQASSVRSLGGRIIVRESSITGGKAFDLVATHDQGWGPTSTCSSGFSRGLIKQILALDTVGWSGILSYEGRSIRVRFRNEEKPVLDVEPLIPRPNQSDDDYYVGRIKLMEV